MKPEASYLYTHFYHFVTQTLVTKKLNRLDKAHQDCTPFSKVTRVSTRRTFPGIRGP